ncbi:MAG: hypothetical protein DMF90_08080, partial [Acidobacteria bacterium]
MYRQVGARHRLPERIRKEVVERGLRLPGSTDRRVEDHPDRLRLQLTDAVKRWRHRVIDRRVRVDDTALVGSRREKNVGGPFTGLRQGVLAGAQLARRKRPHLHDAFRARIHQHIDSSERSTAEEGLDDRDTVHAVGKAGMRVACDNHVDEAGGQSLCHL